MRITDGDTWWLMQTLGTALHRLALTAVLGGAVPDGASAQPEAVDDKAWSAALDSKAKYFGILQRGLVFVGTDTSITAWDVATGREAWRVPGATALAELDSMRVLVATRTGFRVLDADSGKAHWSLDSVPLTKRTGFHVLQGAGVLLAFGPADRQVVRLAAIDLDSGRILWTSDSVIVGDGEKNADKVAMAGYQVPLPDSTAILRFNRGRAFRVAARTGTVIWRFSAEAQLPLGDPYYRSVRPMIRAPHVWLESGVLRFDSGTVAWKPRSKSFVARLVATPRGLLVASHADLDHRDLMLMDSLTATPLWREPRRVKGLGVGAVRGDSLFVPVDKGMVILELATGRPLAQLVLPDFTSREEAFAIDALSDGDLVLESNSNFMRVKPGGEVVFHRHYAIPSVGLQPLNTVVVAWDRNPEGLTYVFTKEEDEAGQKGIVLLEPATARELGTVRRKDRSPSYAIDPASRMAVAIQDRLITGYRFWQKPN